jgi:hypothetical protein
MPLSDPERRGYRIRRDWFSVLVLYKMVIRMPMALKQHRNG